MNIFVSLFLGILIGVGAILPGISGGVLMVTFGFYQPVMALFAHPRENFARVMPKLWPVGIGWVIGFLGIAKVLNVFFSSHETMAICLFLGMIAGTLPSLYGQAGKHGRCRDDFLALAIAFVVMWLFFWILNNAGSMNVQSSPMWFLLAGIIWGLSISVPGLSSSSVLIFMGLFEPMTAGLAAMDFGVILPLLVGSLTTVAVTARVVNRMFHRHYAMCYHTIIGIVLASLVTIIPTGILPSEIFPALALAIVGCGTTVLLGKFQKE